jgi:hypothetical protein
MRAGIQKQQLRGPHAQDDHGIALLSRRLARHQISQDAVNLASTPQTGSRQQPDETPVTVGQVTRLTQGLVKITPVINQSQNLKTGYSAFRTCAAIGSA